jgi:phosphonate transport system substrate-binding protein
MDLTIDLITKRNLNINHRLNKASSLFHCPLKLVLLGITLFLTHGCIHSQKPTNPSSQQIVLRVSLVPTENQAAQEQVIAPLDAHLEKVLGQQVDFLFAKNYQDSVDMLVDGRANSAYFEPVTYLEALEQGAKIEPLTAPIDKFTNRPWHRSCIIVPKNSPIRTLADLKGKRVAFVDTTSTSGYLIPLATLNQLGIEAQGYTLIVASDYESIQRLRMQLHLAKENSKQ